MRRSGVRISSQAPWSRVRSDHVCDALLSAATWNRGRAPDVTRSALRETEVDPWIVACPSPRAPASPSNGARLGNPHSWGPVAGPFDRHHSGRTNSRCSRVEREEAIRHPSADFT